MGTEQRKKILIIDNDENIAGIFQKVLENGGFDTRTTWSGREALELLQSHQFDVLLLDDYLPDLHPCDFLKRIGQLSIRPGIVVMQASAPTARQLRHYLSLGVSGVVRKCHPGEVCDAVETCADQLLAKTYVH